MSYATVVLLTVGAAVVGSAIGILLGLGIEWAIDKYRDWRDGL